MIESFYDLKLNPSIVKALEKENITIPTDIQGKVIPKAMQKKDLIIQSETGTGKTLAYLLPLYEKLDATAKVMQAMVLAPTHELAIQIQRQIERLSQDSEVKLRSATIIGNVNIDRQIDKLKKKPHIIVGSPGRILELIKRKKISAHTIKTIILDEADKLMDDSNFENVKAVIKSTLKERQLMMFSASISKAAEARSKEIMNEAEVIRGEDPLSVPPTIEHMFFMSEQRDKIEVLRKLLHILNPSKAIVFVNEKNETEMYATKLKFHGFKAEGIHGEKIKSDRKRTLDDFKSGKLNLLVSSDIAARGLDIEGVTHVFNINMPEEPRDYLHRVGRTGRAGNTGIAISIVTEREFPMVKHIEKTLNIQVTPKNMYKGKIVAFEPE